MAPHNLTSDEHVRTNLIKHKSEKYKQPAYRIKQTESQKQLFKMELMEMEEHLRPLYKALCNKIDSTKNEIKADVKAELEALKDCQMDTQSRCSNLEVLVTKQQEELIHLKRDLNKCNIIVHGIEVGVEEHENMDIKQEVITVLNKKLQTQLTTEQVSDIYRLGKKQNNPIKICLINLQIKKEVLSKRSKLKGTNIFISEDLPLELRIKKVKRESKKRRKQTQKKE